MNLDEIKIEIELDRTDIFFVVDELDYEDLEILECHVENYRGNKIHFTEERVQEIYKAYEEKIDSIILLTVEDRRDNP